MNCECVTTHKLNQVMKDATQGKCLDAAAHAATKHDTFDDMRKVNIIRDRKREIGVMGERGT